MRRLLVVIRLLRAALRSRPELRRLDFAARVCVDEFCHGMFEGRPVLPWLTMVSCASNPSLPVVQWNTLHGRDPELSRWDAALDEATRALARLNDSWPSRAPKAVWRGSAAETYVTNMHWSSTRKLVRVPVRRRAGQKQWQRQGRAALVWQFCKHPGHLDVFMRGVQGADPVLRVADPEWARCVHALSRSTPKFIPFEQQAARFKYAVHVEGVGGWADRFKHLLRSGSALVRQQQGVTEWFEPLLQPWRHYVPTASTLRNLSDAVDWLRAHDAEARLMATEAAALVHRVMRVNALAYYMEELFVGYASLYRDSSRVPALLRRLRRNGSVARVECDEHGGEVECAFAPLREPGARRTRRRFASLAQMMLANGARPPTNPGC